MAGPDPWGLSEPAAYAGAPPPLPPGLVRLAEVAATGVPLPVTGPAELPSAEQLPEVQALMPAGWRPLDGAPLHRLVPAAWPPSFRTWVPDRLPRVALNVDADDARAFVAWTGDEWDEDFAAEPARAVGLPTPPTDRLWLVRSPWPGIPVSVVFEIIWAVTEARNDAYEIAAFYRAALEVTRWDEQRALAACPAKTRALLDTWAAVGRIGEAAARPIGFGLTPTAVAASGLDEPTLLAWLASLDADLGDDVIVFIRAWRSRRLPGDPPPDAGRFLGRDLDDVSAWLAAGFDLDVAARLDDVELDTARQWRVAGFDAETTYQLLRADPALTPDEAHAFDDGPARDRRRDWIYYGFAASEAAAWTESGLTPYPARLWRALGRLPADVRPGQQWPPQLLEGRRHLAFSRGPDGERRRSEWDEIADPPGTRGRFARRFNRN